MIATSNTGTCTAGKAAQIAGINPETLKVWTRRGFVPNKAEGGWSRYSVSDLIGIMALHRVTVRGAIDISTAAELFREHIFNVSEQVIQSAMANSAAYWIVSWWDEEGPKKELTADPVEFIKGMVINPERPWIGGATLLNLSQIVRDVFAEMAKHLGGD